MTSVKEIYKEKVEIFDLSGKPIGFDDKMKFYREIRKEFAKTRKVTRQVHTPRVFLMNSNEGIYFTKRSKLKKENSLLYDKTIGAHIRFGESPGYTLLRECAEEMGFPASALTEPEFTNALSETDLTLNGVFKEIDTINAFPAKYEYVNGKPVVFPQITTIYIGVFDGPIKFKDGETSGVEVWYPHEILDELKLHPEKYTNDVKILVPRYLPEMKKIINKLRTIRKSC
jgi:hypothetical protein